MTATVTVTATATAIESQESKESQESQESQPLCSILMETFNTTNHKEVSCPTCQYKVCLSCCKKYLLGSIQDAHCMNCRRVWSYEFMLDNFPPSFITGDYKAHRENILVEREKSLFPQRMEAMERVQRGEAMSAQIKELSDKLNNDRIALMLLNTKYEKLCRIRTELLKGVEPSETRLSSEPTVIRIKSCPQQDCRGMLDKDNVCGVCKTEVCSKCDEILELKNHTCKEENVASVKLNKKECKSCPGCGAVVYKESGCSQMWCPVESCHKVFDWNTGQILTGVKIHNPHYYEYLRNTVGAVPRDPDDIGAAAGCYNHDEITQSLTTIYTRYRKMFAPQYYNDEQPLRKYLARMVDIVRLIAHIEQVEMPYYDNTVTNKTNEDIDIRYLTKKITEKQWKTMLFAREKQRMKRGEILQIFEMITHACKDIVLSFISKWIKDVRDKHDEYPSILILSKDVWDQCGVVTSLANTGFEKLAKMYKSKKMPQILLNDEVGWGTRLDVNWKIDRAFSY